MDVCGTTGCACASENTGILILMPKAFIEVKTSAAEKL